MLTASHLVAHRGWQRRYPENTLIGIRAALEAGARQVEIDVQLTADGVPMLFHDRDTQRLCGQDGAVHALTLAQLAPYSAHEPERWQQRFFGTPICTLQQVCELFRVHVDAHLFLEIKRVGIEHFGVDAVLDAILPLIAPLQGRCTLISFAIGALQCAQRKGWADLGPVLIDWPELNSAAVANLQPRVVFADADKIPPDDDLHSAPFPLAVYEIDDIATAEQYLARGVRYIESFAVGEMLAALTAR